MQSPRGTGRAPTGGSPPDRRVGIRLPSRRMARRSPNDPRVGFLLDRHFPTAWSPGDRRAFFRPNRLPAYRLVGTLPELLPGDCLVAFQPPCRIPTLQSQKTRSVRPKTVPTFCDFPVVAQKYYKPARTALARFSGVVWCSCLDFHQNRSKARETTSKSIR